MNKYELALVVTAKIDDNARAEVVEKAKGYITRANGVITGIEEWGKKRLAYEIQYQREAYYYFIHFEAEPAAPALIERDVRIMDNILRYLVVRQDEDFVMPETPAEESAAEEAVEEAVEAEAAESAEAAAEE
ncbi:MAG TPA: 30S ribosomal protein S6 [Candidatus Alectryocaccobium stercorigallinarum]|jgi:small subunit ribosomal protein S6|nr:30S ribosomal protein S6 [Candidatus Alectryocaccobium stercorigallinarum]